MTYESLVLLRGNLLAILQDGNTLAHNSVNNQLGQIDCSEKSIQN